MTAYPLHQTMSFPGNLLRRCHQISVAIFLEDCAKFELTQLQYATLAALEENGAMDQLTLGQLTALDRNTVAVVVKNMEQRGLLKRERNPEDRRFMQVTISDVGVELRQAAEQAVLKTQADILAPLTDDEQSQLVQLLKKISDKNNDRSRVPLKLMGKPA